MFKLRGPVEMPCFSKDAEFMWGCRVLVEVQSRVFHVEMSGLSGGAVFRRCRVLVEVPSFFSGGAE